VPAPDPVAEDGDENAVLRHEEDVGDETVDAAGVLDDPAALSKIDAEGLVRGVCGSPNFESPGTSTEGQAFALLMEAAAADYEERSKNQ